MNGKLVGGGIVGAAALVGAAVFYFQQYHYNFPVVLAQGEAAVELTSLVSGQPEAIIADAFEGTDAESSPIRYRACFTTPMSHALLSETYVLYPEAVPLVAPRSFDCFDAEAIGAALDEGSALAFMGEENIEYGIDRVVAITEDGRGYVWHQINACGEVVFDGNPPPPGCPDPDAAEQDRPREGETNG